LYFSCCSWIIGWYFIKLDLFSCVRLVLLCAAVQVYYRSGKIDPACTFGRWSQPLIYLDLNTICTDSAQSYDGVLDFVGIFRVRLAVVTRQSAEVTDHNSDQTVKSIGEQLWLILKSGVKIFVRIYFVFFRCKISSFGVFCHYANCFKNQVFGFNIYNRRVNQIIDAV
jgi:hypothetical protein